MEYLMPERKKRAAIYVRESDISLAMDSTTMESAVKALLERAEQRGYIVYPENIYKEAISGYHTYYFDRPELMRMLKDSSENQFDVLLVTEIRALSRRGAGEVLVIYNSLQKANVALETLSEVITDDPMGEVLLTFRATWARIEREQSYLRMARGKKDRIEIGRAISNGKRAYGYLLVDTEREIKGKYVFNEQIIYTDRYGIHWSEIDVRRYILSCLKQRQTLRSIILYLNDLGIPPPKKAIKGKPCWSESTIKRIAEAPINVGRVYANMYKKVGKTLVKRPVEEWILLPEAAPPAIIDEETYRTILENLALNKLESIRNNKHPDELGLLRGGYIICGICHRTMTVRYGGSNGNGRIAPPFYRCYRKSGASLDIIHNHRTQIHVKGLDEEVVDEIRKKNRPVVDEAEIEDTVTKIIQKIKNLMKLAEDAPDDEELERYRARIEELGREKREAEKLRYALEDDAQEREEIEKELVRFEAWVERVRPDLTNPDYQATYSELRTAIRILGIRCIVYPTQGDWPFRHQIVATVPEILARATDLRSSRGSPAGHQRPLP
jgi:DNA invertase Pin-like site-specific DNA recombinase